MAKIPLKTQVVKLEKENEYLKDLVYQYKSGYEVYLKRSQEAEAGLEDFKEHYRKYGLDRGRKWAIMCVSTCILLAGSMVGWLGWVR